MIEPPIEPQIEHPIELPIELPIKPPYRTPYYSYNRLLKGSVALMAAISRRIRESTFVVASSVNLRQAPNLSGGESNQAFPSNTYRIEKTG